MEPLTAGGVRLFLDFLRGAYRIFKRRKRSLTAEERIELRQRWRPAFEKFFLSNTRKRLSTEIIIRNVKFLDVYPENNPRRRNGISAWFKVDVVQTYERGFVVLLGIGELFRVGEEQWRYCDWRNGERGDEAWLLGYVPYENVRDVSWDGDQIYDYPHVYCYFDGKRNQPYEKRVFCRKFESNGLPHFIELSDWDVVRTISNKFGLKNFG